MCVIYFCPRFSCCPYYWGICKARADCIYFGSGKREAFKQDMFTSMHLLLLFGGGGEGSKGGLPIMACTRRLCPKGRVSFSDLRYLTLKPQYLNSNSPDWSPYISLKNQLREFVYWSKLFPSGDHFINSRSVFSRLCIDIVEWKDRENCHFTVLSTLLFNPGDSRFWTVSPGLQIRVWNLPDNRQSLQFFISSLTRLFNHIKNFSYFHCLSYF